MARGESELVRAATLGDADALTDLLERHGPEVARTMSIASKWQTVVGADDVMQVTYLEAFLRITDFVPAGPEGFRVWLQRIAENNLKDAIKELGRAKRPQPENRVMAGKGGVSDQSYVDLLQMLSGNGGTPSGAAAMKEAISHVELALGKLPEDYRQAITLYELQGLSVRETAEQMGRSEGAIKMLLARARERLRETLGSASRFFSAGA